MKLHTGDNVVVVAGKDKGKTGRVLRILADAGRVVVAGINMRTRHIRKTPQGPGKKIRYEASMHASNVMLIDAKTRKRTRIGIRFDENGKKERFARKSGETVIAGKKLRKIVEDGKEGEESAKR